MVVLYQSSSAGVDIYNWQTNAEVSIIFNKNLQYIRNDMHKVCTLLGFAMADWSISFRVTSLPLKQSYDCPSANEANLINMG